MATTYTDTATQAYALQARTDAAGAAVDDVTGEDLRLVAQLFGAGVILSPADSWQVKQRAAGANMSVDVGSGDPDTDLAIVAGTDSGQGNYLVRREAATVNVTVPAADLSNPRIDQVFLVVQDNAYDGSARVIPRVAYRDGTPAGSPAAPGPDASWNAYLLLAQISVPAGDTSIEDAQITDSRVQASALVPPAVVPDHASSHATAGIDDIGAILGGFISGGSAREDTADGTLTTTWETGASVVFTKPASWNTYAILVTGAVGFSAAGGGTEDTTTEVRILGTASDISFEQLNLPTTGRNWTIPANAFFTGQSGASFTVGIQYREATGNVSALWKEFSSVGFIAIRQT